LIELPLLMYNVTQSNKMCGLDQITVWNLCQPLLYQTIIRRWFYLWTDYFVILFWLELVFKTK